MPSTEHVGYEAHKEDESPEESFADASSASVLILLWITSSAPAFYNIDNMSEYSHRQGHHEKAVNPELWKVLSLDRLSYTVQLYVGQGVLPKWRIWTFPFDEVRVEKAGNRQ